LTGTVSLVLVLALAFSGYRLPWNSLAVYATKVGTQIIQTSTDFLPGVLSDIGPFLASLLVGSEGVGQQTLTRFFAFHIAILPLIVMALIGAHLVFVQIHGMSVPLSILKADDSPEAGQTWRGKNERFFPEFMLKDAAVWLLFLSALMVLSVVLPYDSLLPYTLIDKYNPLAPAPAGIKPEWYFYFLYYPLEMLPRGLVIAGTAVFFAALISFPWWLAGLGRLLKIDMERSRFPLVVAVIVAIVIVVMTLFGPQIVHLVRGVP
jgi:cytochrome b6